MPSIGHMLNHFIPRTFHNITHLSFSSNLCGEEHTLTFTIWTRDRLQLQEV